MSFKQASRACVSQGIDLVRKGLQPRLRLRLRLRLGPRLRLRLGLAAKYTQWSVGSEQFTCIN